MTDTIGVALEAQDSKFIASTKAAAAEVSKVAAAEERLGKAAAALGVNQKQFAAAFMKVEAQRALGEKKHAKEAEKAVSVAEKVARTEAKRQESIAKNATRANDKALKKVADDEKKAAKAKEAALKKVEAQTKKAQDYRIKSAKESKKNLAEDVGMLKAGALAAVGMGAAVLGVAVAAGATLIAIGKVALSTKEARDNARGMLDVLTKQRGDKSLKLLDGMAVQLGVKLQDVRDDFIKFRQTGLGNKQSAQLIKLKADLLTVDKSGKLADEAVGKVLAFTANGTQTKDQVAAAARAMKLLAKQAAVAGDGSVAAAAGASTLVGALNRLDNSKTKALEDIGDKIQPSVDRAATAVATFVEKLLASKRGQQVIDGVSTAISGMADAVVAALPYVAKAGAFLEKAFANPVVKVALEGLKGLAYVAGGAVAFLAAGAVLLIAPFVAAAAAIGGAVLAVGVLVKKAIDFAPMLYDAGKNMVLGLVRGITDYGSKAVNAISGLAGKIKETFTGAFKINSPSKVFEGYGVNMGEGTDRGLDRAMPTGTEIAERMTPSGAGGGKGGGGRSVTITIQNVNVPAGADPDSWARSLRREMTLLAEALSLSQGDPA